MTTKRTFLLSWLLANGTFAYLCQYVATHPDDAAWARVLTFVVWTFGVLMFGAGMVLEPENLTDEQAEKWYRPEWFVTLDTVFDVAVVVFFVWLGWGWTAGAHLAHIIGISAIRTMAKKRREAKKPEATRA